MKKDLVLIAITKNGVKKAAELHKIIGGDLFVPEKFQNQVTGATFFSKSSKELIPELFPLYREIVWVGALGILVRFIGPLIKDKKTDPAVLSVDEQGKFVISVLSGHLGGANELAEKIADILKAIPVVTTASDVSGTIGVDILGREFGWQIEDFEPATRVSAAVVNGEKVAFVQEAGEKNWWKKRNPLPSNIALCGSIEEAIKINPAALLLVTDRTNLAIPDELLKNTIIYRPKSLAIGMGCNRKVPLEEVEMAINNVLERQNLSFQSIKSFASIDKKNDEKAFLALSEKYTIPFVFYSAEELNTIDPPTPSAYSLKYVGAKGVAEPAAMLCAETETLIEIKQKTTNVTTAVARKQFTVDC